MSEKGDTRIPLGWRSYWMLLLLIISAAVLYLSCAVEEPMVISSEIRGWQVQTSKGAAVAYASLVRRTTGGGYLHPLMIAIKPDASESAQHGIVFHSEMSGGGLSLFGTRVDAKEGGVVLFMYGTSRYKVLQGLAWDEALFDDDEGMKVFVKRVVEFN